MYDIEVNGTRNMYILFKIKIYSCKNVICLVMLPSQAVPDLARRNTNELSLRPLILNIILLVNGRPKYVFDFLMKEVDVNKFPVNIA